MPIANCGGQTLETLIVYLNDVEEGGLTRLRMIARSEKFERSRRDQAHLVTQTGRCPILFFPANGMGRLDERTEHEGCPAVDEKWIARIWRHKSRVPTPFGLSEAALDQP
jgi:hypothetical protein